MANSISVVREYRVDWQAEWFSMNSQESDEFVACECRWTLHLTLRDPGSVKVFLKKLNPGKLTGRYKIQSSIVNHEDEPISTQEYLLDDPDFTTDEIWRISRRQNSWEIVLPDSVLTFAIIFTQINPPGTDTAGGKATPLEQLSIDLSKLFDSEESSDVVLKCGEQEIRAHKHILAARSARFAAMVGSDMWEAQEGVVVIEAMDPDIFDALIRYIYSGKVDEMNLGPICELYEVADKYGIESLRDCCASFMAENLSETVACDFLRLAEAHNDEELKNSAIAFMADRNGFLNTEQWNKFSEEHPAMAVKVYKRHVDSKAAKK